MTTVHVVLPEGVDDPGAPSGGNLYDRRVCQGLSAAGWRVVEHAAPGAWPMPDQAAEAHLGAVLDRLPDHAAVLVDGLVGSAAAAVLAPAAPRLRLVPLVHLPLGLAADGAVRESERAALGAAAAVVTTSGWTRSWLLDAYGLPPDRVRVAHPGVDPAAPASGSTGGGRLLCVGAVLAAKGQHDLVAALAAVADLDWTCVVAGSLTREPGFAAELRRRVSSAGLGDRIRFVGPLDRVALDRAYRAADLVVHPSHGETYAMVVTEALARGLPVLATGVGGLPEALGVVAGGERPGLLVPPGDPGRLAGAVRDWLTDAALRRRLRARASARRSTLGDWSGTAQQVAAALGGAAA